MYKSSFHFKNFYNNNLVGIIHQVYIKCASHVHCLCPNFDIYSFAMKVASLLLGTSIYYSFYLCFLLTNGDGMQTKLSETKICPYYTYVIWTEKYFTLCNYQNYAYIR